MKTMSKRFPIAANFVNMLMASLLNTSAQFSTPRVRMLYWMHSIAGRWLSMNTTREAPRLNASKPMAPVPAKISRNTALLMLLWHMSKSVSLRRFCVGRVLLSLGDLSSFCRYIPLMMRMVISKMLRNK